MKKPQVTLLKHYCSVELYFFAYLDFVLRLLSNACSVRFDDLERLASLTGALADRHEWIGVYVMDELLEFIRLSLEVEYVQVQQRALASLVYLGQLFNYNICEADVIFRVFL